MESHKLSTPILTKLFIEKDSFLYKTNYPIKDIQEAYLKSCQKTGLQFHDNNLILDENSESCQRILTNSCETYITENKTAILKYYNIIDDELIENLGIWHDDNELCITSTDELAAILIRFIAFSMPSDFIIEPAEDKRPQAINEFENDYMTFGKGISD